MSNQPNQSKTIIQIPLNGMYPTVVDPSCISTTVTPKVPDIEGQLFFNFNGIECTVKTSEIDAKKICQDCKGSGKYIGLNAVEACSSCKGTGTI